MAARIPAQRKLRLEPLERREVLDGTPQIVGADLGSAKLLELGDRSIFVQEDQLWQIDGNEAIQLEAAPPLANGRLFGDQYYFVTPADADGLSQLWRTDGTDQGTVQLAQHLGGFHDVSFMSISDGANAIVNAYFWTNGGTELWQTDGTDDGTLRIATNTEDGFEGPFRFSPWGTVSDGTLYFWSNGTDHRLKLWKIDNAQSRAVLVKDLGWPPDVSGLRMKVDLNEDFLFTTKSDNGQTQLWKIEKATGAAGYTVWRDGLGTTHTEADYDVWKSNYGNPTIELLKEFSGGPNGTRTGDSQLFIQAGDRLWRTDGTAQGTYMLADKMYGSRMEVTGDRLFFLGRTEDSGVELWTSDGTIGGTHIVKDIVPGRGSGCGGSQLAPWITAGDKLFFTAYNEQGQLGLWSSDGTEEGTVELLDQDVKLEQRDSSGGVVYFNASNEEGQLGLWSSDGTNAGTVQLLHEPATIRDTGDGVVYFTGSGPSTVSELWRSDGTVEGTELVVDIHPGPDPYVIDESGKYPTRIYTDRIDDVKEVGGTLYFTGNDSVHGNQLWRIPLETDEPSELTGRVGASSLLVDGASESEVRGDAANQEELDAALVNWSHTTNLSESNQMTTDVDALAESLTDGRRTGKLHEVVYERVVPAGRAVSTSIKVTLV